MILVQQCRFAGWAAPRGERGDLHDDLALPAQERQRVANRDCLAWLGDPLRFAKTGQAHAARVDHFCGQCSGFVEPRAPEPFIDPLARRAPVFARCG